MNLWQELNMIFDEMNIVMIRMNYENQAIRDTSGRKKSIKYGEFTYHFARSNRVSQNSAILLKNKARYDGKIKITE